MLANPLSKPPEVAPLTAADSLLRKLYGPMLSAMTESEIGRRKEFCARCHLRAEDGYCGEPRILNLMAPRDEAKYGDGMLLSRRLTGPECRCPLGLWEAAGRREVETAEVGCVNGKQVSFFIGALGEDNAGASLLADQIYGLTGIRPFLLDERRAGVCTNKPAAPFYCHDFLAPEADYLVYMSAEMYLGELPPLNFADVSLYRMPSVIGKNYHGFFVASRNVFPIFDWCRDLNPAVAFDSFVALAERSVNVEVIPDSLFFPMRSARDGEPKSFCLFGLDVESRNRLLRRMHQSPRPWREVCCHFSWIDDLRKSEPYPDGTEISFDCGHAGIGDMIDAAHVARAVELENPGVSVRVYSSEAKKGFIELFRKTRPGSDVSLVHSIPPAPWHQMDYQPSPWHQTGADCRSTRTRIENWAIHCGATKPVLAKPLISEESEKWAADFLGGLPSPVVALSPISTSPSRMWPLERYEALGELLNRSGYGVIVIDDPEGVAAQSSRFKRLFGVGAEREAAVIRKCGLLVGNDSGMAHLSASMEIPTLAICGPTDGRAVFGWYKSVRWIEGSLPCSACYFHKRNGWSEECEYGCRSIYTVGVQQVFRECVSLLPTSPGVLRADG